MDTLNFTQNSLSISYVTAQSLAHVGVLQVQFDPPYVVSKNMLYDM